MRTAEPKPITVPSCGVVKGGRLHAWRFHFICFRVDERALEIVARWTPPAWPFFREFGADHTHFSTLRTVAGDRAKRIPAVPLITTAYRAEGLEPPYWLDAQRMTLRALIKRTHGTHRRTI